VSIVSDITPESETWLTDGWSTQEWFRTVSPEPYIYMRTTQFDLFTTLSWWIWTLISVLQCSTHCRGEEEEELNAICIKGVAW